MKGGLRKRGCCYKFYLKETNSTKSYNKYVLRNNGKFINDVSSIVQLYYLLLYSTQDSILIARCRGFFPFAICQFTYNLITLFKASMKFTLFPRKSARGAHLKVRLSMGDALSRGALFRRGRPFTNLPF